MNTGRAHFQIKPTTGGKITHGSEVHNPQHRGEHESRWKQMPPQSSTASNGPWINKALSPSHAENSPVTSAPAFGGSGCSG